MEPLSILMSSIFKVVEEIATAARTARRNKRRCLELAERVQTISGLSGDSKAANDTVTRGRVLGRLKGTLADALKLVESCSRRSGWFCRLLVLASGRQAGRFDDVERRINNCLLELGIANDARLHTQVAQLAARGHPSTSAKAGSTGKGNTNNHDAKKKDDVAMKKKKKHKKKKDEVAMKKSKKKDDVAMKKSTAAAAAGNGGSEKRNVM